MLYSNLPSNVQSYMNNRAGNYPGTSGTDLWEMLPDSIQDKPQAIMDFLQGNPELGVEAHEVGHIISDMNGGLETPDNLMWQAESLNDKVNTVPGDNMDAWDIMEANMENEAAAEILVNEHSIEIVDAIISGNEVIASASEATPEVIEVVSETTSLVPEITTEVVTATADVGGGLAESIGETLIEGVAPVFFGAKAAIAVADQFDKPEDKMGYGALAAGATAGTIYFIPVVGWALGAITIGKLVYNVADAMNKSAVKA